MRQTISECEKTIGRECCGTGHLSKCLKKTSCRGKIHWFGRKRCQPQKDLGKEHPSQRVLRVTGLEVEMILAYPQASMTYWIIVEGAAEPRWWKDLKALNRVLCEAMGGLHGKQGNETMDLQYRLLP